MDHDLNREVAEGVMGWTLRDGEYWASDGCVMKEHDWQPTANRCQAALVALKAKIICTVQITSGKEPWLVSPLPHEACRKALGL